MFWGVDGEVVIVFVGWGGEYVGEGFGFVYVVVLKVVVFGFGFGWVDGFGFVLGVVGYFEGYVGFGRDVFGNGDCFGYVNVDGGVGCC